MTQDEALALLKTGASVFLTGQPGSGKTHTVNRYIQWLKRQGIDYAYTASTGIAATHGHGMTIHAWSGIGVRETLTRAISIRSPPIAGSPPASRRRSVLMIDEISMLPARSLTLVDTVCRHIRGVPSPFGGCKSCWSAISSSCRRSSAANASRRCCRSATANTRSARVRPCLPGLARSCAHRLLFVRAAPAERQAVSRRARRHPRQCLRTGIQRERLAARQVDRDRLPSGLHAAVHA